MSKSKKNYNSLIIFLIVAGIIGYSIYTGKINLQSFLGNQSQDGDGGKGGQGPVNPSVNPSYTVILSSSRLSICLGDPLTAYIDSNINNGKCWIYMAPVNTNNWVIFTQVQLNSNGDWQGSANINTVGQAKFYVKCCDNNMLCADSNQVVLVVSNCGPTTTINPCPEVCLHVGTRSQGWYNSCTGALIRYDSHCTSTVTTTTTPSGAPSDSSCNTYCMGFLYNSGRGVTSPGYCNAPEISKQYGGGYCCCMPQVTTTTIINGAVQSANDCTTWQSFNNMGYYVYDPWGMTDATKCYNNANGYCTQFGWTLGNYMFSQVGCCIWNCNKPTTTTTIPSCYNSCLAITSAEYGSGKFNSQLRIPNDCGASCVSYCSEAGGCIRSTWYQISGASEQCCCWQCGIWE